MRIFTARFELPQAWLPSCQRRWAPARLSGPRHGRLRYPLGLIVVLDKAPIVERQDGGFKLGDPGLHRGARMGDR